MSKEETLERIRAGLGDLPFVQEEPRDGMPCVAVEREVLHDALRALRDRAGFETVTLVTCVDRYERMREPRFEVVHQLLSIVHADRVRVRTRVASDAASVPTCVDLWPGASFMEREAYDLFGVVFEGHPDLRRLLMPEDYGHHPLRKEFPHRGIEPDRLYRKWDRERRKDWPTGDLPPIRTAGGSSRS